MFSKKRIALMAIQFPIALLIGVLLTFAYSMQVHEHPEINWSIAIPFGIVLDVAVTWLQNRNEKQQSKMPS